MKVDFKNYTVKCKIYKTWKTNVEVRGVANRIIVYHEKFRILIYGAN